MPPSSRPKAPPPAAIALQTPSAFVRSSPSANVVVMIDSAAGETSAPPRPWSARAPTSQRLRRREPVQQRGGREDRDAREEEPAAAEQVARAAAEQQEAAEHERVGVDDPLEVRGAEPEVGLDRRQRDVDHRRVEHDHELREADDDEDDPAVALGIARARGLDELVLGLCGGGRHGTSEASNRYTPPSTAAVVKLVYTRRSGRRGGNPVEVRVLSAALRCYPAQRSLPLSSRGLGRRPLTAETGVRIPVAVPQKPAK